MRNMVLVCLLLAGCTEKNPNVCSVDPDCGDGLVCRGNSCIAETCGSSAQCEAAAPYCLANGLCASACDADAECPGFGGTAGDIYCVSGSCAECRMDADCPTTAPVCDAGSCRGCSADDECPSRACGDNGACISSDAVVYVDGTTGIDAGTCTQAAPCATLQYGVQNTLANRSHLVLASAVYAAYTSISSTDTSAPAITIHGGGATLEPLPNSDNYILFIGDVATTLADVTIKPNLNSFSTAIKTSTAPATIRRVKVLESGGFQVGANLTLTDVEIANPTTTAISINNTSHLLLDRVSIHGGRSGIVAAAPGAILSISNLLLYDLTETPLSLDGATGTIQFSTVFGTAGFGTPARLVSCSAGLTIQSTIIWGTAVLAPAYGACAVSNSIAGPGAVGGGTTQTNVTAADPGFVDQTHRDFHLTATSPAVDVAGSGPPFDLELTARPQGASFDFGAYERKP